MEKMKSRKLWISLITEVILIVPAILGQASGGEAVALIVGVAAVAAVYIFSQGQVDASAYLAKVAELSKKKDPS